MAVKPKLPVGDEQQLTPTGELSLAYVLREIETDPILPESKKRRWRSCLVRLARYLNRDLDRLPAHMTGLRYGVARLHHVQLGISKKNLQNLRSDLKGILRYAGAIGVPSPRNVELGRDWQALYDRLDSPRHRRGLSAFMRFCTYRKISPSRIDDRVVERFVEATTESRFTAKPRTIHKDTARIWNEAVTKVDSWPKIVLTVPDHRPKAKSIPWDQFPASFRADVEAHLAWLSGRDILDEDAPARPCNANTLRTRQRYIHAAASAAVRGGIALDSLKSLKDLVSPPTMKLLLEAYLPEDGRVHKTFVIDLASILTAIAARWCKPSAGDLTTLQGYRRKLQRHRRLGLTEKNLAVVRAVRDPKYRNMLLHLPRKLMQEALKATTANYRASVKAQLAVALQILLCAPMRIGNLVALSIDANVLEPAGPQGPIHLFIPDRDVKNAVPLEYPLPSSVAAMIRIYRRTFRDRMKGANSPWLFPGEMGEHKASRTMSQQLTDVIYRETGIRITPHQLRAVAAAIILEADPGNYELVRRVLGHKNIQTTVNFYIGLETVDAARRYAEMVLPNPDDPK